MFVAVVGDGLSMAVHTFFGEVVHIDCGSQYGNETALNGLERTYSYISSPDIFILSHYHKDHYNGLLYASIKQQRIDKFRIREVYYPRIPEFREREEFLLKLDINYNMDLSKDQSFVSNNSVSKSLDLELNNNFES